MRAHITAFRQLITSKYLRHFFTYIGGALVVRSTHLLFVPLWMKLLTPSEYGLLDLLTNFQLVAMALSSMGLIHSANISLFQTKNKVDEQHLLGSIIGTHLVVAIPILLCLALGIPLVNRYLFYSYATLPIIIAILLTCFLDFYSLLGHMLLTQRYQSTLATVLQVAPQVGALGLTYLLVVVYKKGVGGIIYAQLIAQLFSASTKSLVVCHLYRPILPSTDYFIAQAYSNIKTGSSFVAQRFSLTLLNNVDRFILVSYTSLHAVGIYALAAKVGLIINECIFEPFFQVYYPFMYRQYQENKAPVTVTERIRRQHLLLFVAVCCVGATAGYLLIAPFAHTVLPIRFRPALPLSYFMGLEQIFLAGSIFAMIHTRYLKKIYLFTSIILCANSINCCLNLMVVKKYGIWGCTATTVLCAFGTLIASVIIARRTTNRLIAPSHTTSLKQPAPHPTPPQQQLR